MSEAVAQDNQKLANYLVKKGARMFNEDIKYRDKSAFFKAVNIQAIWAIELFCDMGADLNVKSSEGLLPLMYAAKKGFDDTTMYLGLRSGDINMED